MFYELDEKLSFNMYNSCKSYIRIGECYANVNKIVTRYMIADEKYKDFKIAFGAWEVKSISSQNVYFKHCFFMLGDKVVDPTAYTKTIDKAKYIVIKTYSLSEYISMIDSISKQDSWLLLLQEIYNGAFERLLKENITLAG